MFEAVPLSHACIKLIVHGGNRITGKGHHRHHECIAKRILSRLTSIVLEPNVCCSASIGIAVQTAFTLSPEMYQAKKAGKNRFVIFDGSQRTINSM